MNATLIFKMEMFKFLNDKRYLIITGVLGIANTLSLILLKNSIESSYMSYGDDMSGGIVTIVGFLVIGTMIFAFYFPFHVLGMDYKNNVMSLMVASGVNRTQLYFSKIGAAILASLAIAIITIIIPIAVLLMASGSLGFFVSAMEEVFSSANVILFLFYMMTSYVYSTVLIGYAVIVRKGSGSSIGIWLLISLALSWITGLLSDAFGISYMYGDQVFLFGCIIDILFIAGLMALSIRTMQKQSL